MAGLQFLSIWALPSSLFMYCFGFSSQQGSWIPRTMYYIKKESEVANIDRKQNGGSRRLGRGGNGEKLFHGYRVWFFIMKRVLDIGWVHSNVNVLNTIQLYTCKWLKW